MKPPRAALLGLLSLLLCSGAPRLSHADVPTAVPGEVLVGIKAANDTADIRAKLAGVAGKTVGHHPSLHVYRLRIKPGMSMADAIGRLRQLGQVTYAEPNLIRHAYASPNDTSYSSQWALPRIQADSAWSSWKPQAQVIIGVIDTGIDYTHPDLANKILRDSSGNVVGYNAVGTNAHSGVSTDPADDYGHGTHVAGIAAAQINNSVGVAGIAGWDGSSSSDSYYVKLMPVKVLDSSGNGTDATVADGITWAVDHGARVINLSLGGTGTSTTLQNAVNYALSKNAVVVAAAGNDGTSTPGYPAAYSGVISVAATDGNDTLTSWSTWGSWVTTAAPGLSILSTLPTYATTIGATSYGTLSGTSMATPHAAGEAALLLAQSPGLTGNQVAQLINGNTDAYQGYSGRTLGSGAGRVNVYKALQSAGGGTTLLNPPTGLVAQAGDGLIRIAWDEVVGATGYKLYRATSSGGETVLVPNVGTTSYWDTGLTNGTTYFYQVSTLNAAGEGARTGEVSATPQGTASVPGTPTNLTASAGNAQVSLSWSASTGATSYNLYRSTSPGGEGTSAFRSGLTSTSFTDTSVSNGTTYYYTVTAVNAAGQSGFSNEASATPQAPPAPPSTSAQLLGNPGFENGGNGAPWSTTPYVIDGSAYEPAHSGSWKAWLCGYGYAHTDTLAQQVSIPSTVSSAKLSFWLHIDTFEPATGARDTLAVQIRSASGQVLTTLASYSNLDAAAGYQQRTFDLSAYRGQTIVVYVVGQENSYYQTSFVLDDFALNVQ